MTTLNESWQRFPEARIRMREQDLATLVKSLSAGGIFISDQPRVSLHEDGVMITFTANAGTSGKLIALPVDVFIPCTTEVQSAGPSSFVAELSALPEPGHSPLVGPSTDIKEQP